MTAVNEIANEVAWIERGNCVGQDTALFFPTRGASQKDAKALCATCPVKVECLEYAMVNTIRDGVWGGLSERARRRLRKERADARVEEGGSRRGKAPSEHGAAIRALLADGEWHSLDELVGVVARTLGTDDMRLAKKRVQSVLWNMGRDPSMAGYVHGEGKRRHRRYRLI